MQEAIDSGVKFYASIRNPLARIVEFNRTPLRVLAGKDEPYTQYFDRVINGEYDENPHVKLMSEMIIGDPIFIIRFENLQEDYSTICKMIDGVGILPHRNPGDGIPWEEKFLSQSVDIQLALIDKVRPDMDRFGYVSPV